MILLFERGAVFAVCSAQVSANEASVINELSDKPRGERSGWIQCLIKRGGFTRRSVQEGVVNFPPTGWFYILFDAHVRCCSPLPAGFLESRRAAGVRTGCSSGFNLQLTCTTGLSTASFYNLTFCLFSICLTLFFKGCKNTYLCKLSEK